MRDLLHFQDVLNKIFYCYHIVVLLICPFFTVIFLSEYEEELQALSGVREKLEKVSSDKSTLQKELSNLEGKYKVMETLRDSQETELQTLKVKNLLLDRSYFCLGRLCIIVTEIYNRQVWPVSRASPYSCL